MDEVRTYLDDRALELEHHLDLLRLLDERSKEAPASEEAQRVGVSQLLILKSGILVHIYNIVEATFSRVLDNLVAEVHAYHPKTYTHEILRAWVGSNLEIGLELNLDRLRNNVADIGSALVNDGDWPNFTIKKGTGNWCDDTIEKLATKLGVTLVYPDGLRERVKRHYSNDDTRLQYIKRRRNQLAHGVLTFEEGAADRTVEDLNDISTVAIDFMKAVVTSFSNFIEAEAFLKDVA